MSNEINERFFFDYIRLQLFDGSLSSKQVSGLKSILGTWSEKHAGNDDRFLAYMLGTAHHETGRTMQPIKEWGGNSYFFKMYDPQGQRPDVARRLGNSHPGDGVKFCGRGYVQLTGRANYTNWAGKTGKPLVDNPDLALDPDVAAIILIEGMIAGSFTGKKLSDYFSAGRADWVNARRIINGLDKAQLVGSYAMKYYAAISYTT
jgi:hypothetical protein